MNTLLISGDEHAECCRLGKKDEKISWREKEANIKAELTGRTPHLAASCTLLEQLQCGQPFTSPPEKGIPSMISREEIPRHFCLFPQLAGTSAMIQFLLQSSVQFWSVKTFPWKPVPLKLPFIKLFPHRVFQMNQLLLSTELPVTRVSSLCSKCRLYFVLKASPPKYRIIYIFFHLISDSSCHIITQKYTLGEKSANSLKDFFLISLPEESVFFIQWIFDESQSQSQPVWLPLSRPVIHIQLEVHSHLSSPKSSCLLFPFTDAELGNIWSPLSIDKALLESSEPGLFKRIVCCLQYRC